MAMKRIGSGTNVLKRIPASEMKDGDVAIADNGKYIICVKDISFLVLDSSDSYDSFGVSFDGEVAILPPSSKVTIEFFNK